MTPYDEQLSALVDGELEPAEADRLIDKMLDNDELRSRWLRYQQAGSALRREASTGAGGGLLPGIHAALAKEATVLAPRLKRQPLSATFKQVAGMAVAATVTAVAVLTIQPGGQVFAPTNQQVASTAPVAVEQQWLRVNSSNWSDDRPAVVSKLNSYLVNHNGYSTAVRGALPFAPIVTAGRDRPVADLVEEGTAAIEYKPAVENALR